MNARFVPIADILSSAFAIAVGYKTTTNTYTCCNFPFGLNLSTMAGRFSATVANILSIGKPECAANCWICSLPNAARS